MVGFKGMISLWLGLNAADLVTTLLALENGCSEGNLIVGDLGIAGLIIYKVAVTLAVVALLIWIKKPHLFKWLCAGMGAVVVWNSIWVVI